MILLKRNIKIALGVICIMLVILMLFQFAPDSFVPSVFNMIGVVCPMKFASNVTAFVITITSGILGSTIVALVFYVNEYYSVKRKLIHEIIRESNKFQAIYDQIPYLATNGDYYKIERNFYYEVLENREIQKTIEDMQEILETVDKDYPVEIKREAEENIEKLKEQQKDKYKEVLKSILEENPDFRQSRLGKNTIPVEQTLEDIVVKYDLYIEQIISMYILLKELKYEKLELLVEEYSGFFDFSLKVKRMITTELNKCDNEKINIYPFTNDEEVSAKMICERILNVHKNFYKKLETILLLTDNMKDDVRKREGLSYLLHWQDELFKDDIKKIPIIDDTGNTIKKYEIVYTYNRLSMCIGNLHKILYTEVSGVFELEAQENFAKIMESIEYGSLNTTISFWNEDIGNIFRK